MAEKKCCGNCACWKPTTGVMGKCQATGSTTSRSGGSSCKFWR